jgi:hypothetical protein
MHVGRQYHEIPHARRLEQTQDLASLARGSQKCSGTCALLASAATMTSAIAAGGAAAAPASQSSIANDPVARFRRTAPARKRMDVMPVTSRAMSAAARASARARSKPISR